MFVIGPQKKTRVLTLNLLAGDHESKEDEALDELV